MDYFQQEDSIKLAGIVRESITDGPGICFAIFCQGCPHACKGCHNPETWSFVEGGRYVDNTKLLEEIDKDLILQGVTFSGGEPLCQTKAFAKLSDEIKKRHLKINLFTGYTYEDICERMEYDKNLKKLMNNVDILIDGKYEDNLRNLSLKFRGSENQRIIDMVKTREEGKIVLANEYMV